MTETLENDTVAIRACIACEAPLIETEKYCRWCGGMQHPESSLSEAAEKVVSCEAVYITRRLGKSDICHPVSGPLMKAVARGIPAGRSASLHGGFIRALILSFISIPIWMMIVLLSPLDAYAAAKIISNRI